MSRVLKNSVEGSEALPEGHAVLKAGAIRHRGEMPDFSEKPRDPMLVDGALVVALTELAQGRCRWPLFLTGDVGSGKTCAALRMIDIYGGWYLTVPKLLDRLIRAQKRELEYFSPTCVRTVLPYEVWGEIRTMNLVVLDELGTRRDVSDHHYESVLRFLQEREGKPTIYISNLSVAQLGKLYDERVRSRLAFGTSVTLKGDRRMKAKE